MRKYSSVLVATAFMVTFAANAGDLAEQAKKACLHLALEEVGKLPSAKVVHIDPVEHKNYEFHGKISYAIANLQETMRYICEYDRRLGGMVLTRMY